MEPLRLRDLELNTFVKNGSLLKELPPRDCPWRVPPVQKMRPSNLDSSLIYYHGKQVWEQLESSAFELLSTVQKKQKRGNYIEGMIK